MNNAEQQLEAMTEDEKVEWFGNFLGLKVCCVCCGKDVSHSSACDECDCVGMHAFENGEYLDLEDWNHWRQVEVKAANNHRLWHEFMHLLGINTTGTCVPSDCSKMYVHTPLENRARALFIAFHSLPH